MSESGLLFVLVLAIFCLNLGYSEVLAHWEDISLMGQKQIIHKIRSKLSSADAHFCKKFYLQTLLEIESCSSFKFFHKDQSFLKLDAASNAHLCMNIDYLVRYEKSCRINVFYKKLRIGVSLQILKILEG